MKTPWWSSSKGLPGGDGVSGGVESGERSESESDPWASLMENGSSENTAEVSGSMSLSMALE